MIWPLKICLVWHQCVWWGAFSEEGIFICPLQCWRQHSSTKEEAPEGHEGYNTILSHLPLHRVFYHMYNGHAEHNIPLTSALLPSHRDNRHSKEICSVASTPYMAYTGRQFLPKLPVLSNMPMDTSC